MMDHMDPYCDPGVFLATEEPRAAVDSRKLPRAATERLLQAPASVPKVTKHGSLTSFHSERHLGRPSGLDAPLSHPARLTQQSRTNALTRSAPLPVYHNGCVLLSETPVPRGHDLATIGWLGTASRQEAEAKLKASNIDGTFAVRYSHNAGSYVLSYRKSTKILHIAFIHPSENGSVLVDKEDGTQCQYESLFAYVTAMRRGGVIGEPWQDPSHDIYAVCTTLA